MKKMKAAVLTEPYHIEYVETEMPEPRPGEVLIKTCYAGICGSELHAYKGLHKKRVPPVIMGHEISGLIAGLGEGSKRFRCWRPRDRRPDVRLRGSAPSASGGRRASARTRPYSARKSGREVMRSTALPRRRSCTSCPRQFPCRTGRSLSRLPWACTQLGRQK